MDEKLQTLNEWLLTSHYTVALTGAGMSTESGLPDFRSNQGLWHGKDPQEIASTYALTHNRAEFVEFYRWRIRELAQYEPHEGHYILTHWQRQGLLESILTQNVDGFHHRAASHNVIELHGSLRKVYCMDCRSSYASERYLEEQGEVCPNCSGFLRPDIVLFGEMLNESAVEEAFREASQAELFLVLGSSLQVSPANLLPLEAKEHGAKFVVINKEPTDMDEQADLTIQGKIGDVLSGIKTLLDRA